MTFLPTRLQFPPPEDPCARLCEVRLWARPPGRVPTTLVPEPRFPKSFLSKDAPSLPLVGAGTARRAGPGPCPPVVGNGATAFGPGASLGLLCQPSPASVPGPSGLGGACLPWGGRVCCLSPWHPRPVSLVPPGDLSGTSFASNSGWCRGLGGWAGGRESWASSLELQADASSALLRGSLCSSCCPGITGPGADQRQLARALGSAGLPGVCGPPWGGSRGCGGSLGTPCWSPGAHLSFPECAHDPWASPTKAHAPLLPSGRAPQAHREAGHRPTHPSTGQGQEAMLGRAAGTMFRGGTQRPRKITDVWSMKGRCLLHT